MTRPTDVLIHELATELAPVQPVPRLRTVVSLALVAGGATGAAWIVYAGAHLADHPRERLPYLVALLATSAIAALGGICAAGASPVPGRERVQAIGTRVLVAGLVAGAFAALASASALPPEPVGLRWFEAGAACVARVALLALPCAALLFHFARRGTPERQTLALGLAGASAATLASVAASVSCPTCDLTHALVFHHLGPALLAALGAVLLLARPGSPRAG